MAAEDISGSKQRILRTTSPTEIAIDATNFPDAAFRAYVEENFDTNPKDGKLSQDEIAVAISIDVSNNETIIDLTGMQHFRALQYLRCYNTGITSLDISKNSALQYLDCSDTEIDKLDVSQNSALKSLYCENTGITSLDVTSNSALQYLRCFDTGIKLLDVSKNPALEELDCSDTGIETLDVSKNPALEELYCYNTEISSLDVSKNPALETLYCYNTGITELDVSKNPALEELYCSDTGIETLDVSKNTDLLYLICANTAIETLDVTSNSALQYLYCYNTGITELDVSKNPALEELDCSDTGIETLDVSKNPVLVTLNCSNTEIDKLDVSKNTALEFLYCFDTEITSLDISKNLVLKELHCSATCVWNSAKGRYEFDLSKYTDVTKVISWEPIRGGDYDRATGIVSFASAIDSDSPALFQYQYQREHAALLNVYILLDTEKIYFGGGYVPEEELNKKDETVWNNPFIDVKATDWFYNAVKYAHQNGLMGGMTSTTFAPNTPLTRGMLVTILYRMEGSPTVTGDMPFVDVNSDAYYHNAILWAVQNNIVSGISATEFAPDANITREQLAAILQRYAQYKGYDTTQGGMQIREYSDYEDISGYALNAMTWAVNSGLLKGKGENTIAPQDTATRAEVAAILQRFIENNK